MINYDLDKIKALAFDVDGVLSASLLSLNASGAPMRTVNIKDGYALQLAVKLGLQTAIITGGTNPEVRLRYENLGVQHIYMACSIKIMQYDKWLAECGLKDENVLYMGDDIPDYEVMSRCGCPCCPADAAPEIKAISKYVSSYSGGQGCVRDVIEQVLRSQGLWKMNATAFGW